MNAVIISSKASALVHEAIGNTDVSFEKTGRFEGGQFVEFCEAVARININAFITDIDCTDAQTFLRGISQYRVIRPNTKIIVIALDRYEDDGVVHELADMGINVVTTSPGTKPKSIIPALRNLLPERDQGGMNAASQDDWESTDSEMEKVKERIYRYTAKLTSSGGFDSSDVMDLELPDVPIQERIILKDRIIGTILVAVMGVESKVGSTHQSILIANYLKRKGYSVGLVEANASSDFTAIENAYEGTPDFKSNNLHFTIEGVEYYKNNSKLDINHLVTAGHDYLILDIGGFEESDWSTEFYRASVNIVVGAGSDWRQGKIRRFRDIHKKMDQSNWVYCIPFVENLSIQDIRKELPGNLVYRIPPHADPYKHQSDTESVLNKLMKSYMGDSKKLSSKSMLYGILGLCILIIIVLIILLAIKI
ncbi:hypothetical protein [Paenibacillus silvae]|uniref:Uncharacterized protein n=1 Tax=Paenibacillus silvae TaxID=1325358 RepID=A0A2W6N9G0_9BACL|nr:hypothetical protein [Paenibacillus silvae]PZT52602.1 hypothetical protein DN757_26530 [Paenibacillus silvae]